MRALSLALALLAAGCTWLPDVSDLEPKSAADCPGRKACGPRCVDFDDPEAGCATGTCRPCPAGPANTVPSCGELSTCGYVCARGFADCDATPGCERAVSTDGANCGACGHACEPDVACLDGQCQGMRTVVSDTGEAPRGIALASLAVVWATDPPVAGGVTPKGALHRAFFQTGDLLDVTEGFGHPTFVRSQAVDRPEVAVAGTDPADGGPLAWLVDTSQAPITPVARGGGQADGAIVGLALTADWVVSLTGPPNDIYSFESYDGNSSGGGGGFYPLTGLGEGGGFLWISAGRSDTPGGVYRFAEDPGFGYSVVAGGGVYFDDLPAGVEPEAHRIGAQAGPTPSDPVTLWFADLRDGSIWTGRTTGPDTAVPWRLVRGDGRPRTAMDVAADRFGAVWSDLEAGEIWAQRPDGQVHRLATGIRPWAIALTPGFVYFTDVEAREIREVQR
jgi:hypothetical protein